MSGNLSPRALVDLLAAGDAEERCELRRRHQPDLLVVADPHLLEKGPRQSVALFLVGVRPGLWWLLRPSGYPLLVFA